MIKDKNGRRRFTAEEWRTAWMVAESKWNPHGSDDPGDEPSRTDQVGRATSRKGANTQVERESFNALMAETLGRMFLMQIETERGHFPPIAGRNLMCDDAGYFVEDGDG